MGGVPEDPREVLTRPAPPPDETVRYGDDPEQLVDLRWPLPGGPPRPLVAVIHGGFWRAEFDRVHTGPLAVDLVRQGYPVAQLEYRRTGQPGGGWPGTFDDIVAGVRALPRLLAERGYEPAGPPVLLGHSAGGHLALWLAGQDVPVRAVVALAPATCLVEVHRLGLGDGAVAALLGGSPEQVPERYREAEPRPRPGVPVTVIHGDADRVVPVALSRRWAAAAGARLDALPGVGHFALIDPRSSSWQVVSKSIAGIVDGFCQTR